MSSSAIPHFTAEILISIDFSFILVSGDCDETIPDEILDQTLLLNLLNDNRLIHWFCQNMTIDHNKITRIPIGLDYHTLTTQLLCGVQSVVVKNKKQC